MPRARKSEQKEEALRLRVEGRLSLKEILKTVRVSPSTLSVWLRDHPLTEEEQRAKMSTVASRNTGRHWRLASKDCSPQLGAHTNAPADVCLRSAAVGIAIDWFSSRGYVPSLPLDQSPYDLVVESDDGLKRVQIKSTNRKDRGGRWSVDICRHVYAPDRHVNSSGKRRREAYQTVDVDLIFIVTGSRDVYLIPLDAIRGKHTLSLDRSYTAYHRGVA